MDTTGLTRSLGLGPGQVEAVLRAAVSAPSAYNTQPWRFRVLDDRIEVHADLGRRLPATDPQDRELRVACGAALFNIRLALTGLHIRPLVTLVPERKRPELLAVVRHGGRVRLDEATAALLSAIPKRRTNRRPFLDRQVPRSQVPMLVKAAEHEQCWLHPVEEPAERASLLGLVHRAHRRQQQDPGFHAEFAAWTGHDDGRPDGVPHSSGGPLPEPQDSWVLRDFTGGRGRERLPGKDFEDQPLIAVLCSFYDGPRADLTAGQALQRVLLTATTLGLSCSFISPPVEVPAVREDLRRLLGGGLYPQSVLRLGYGAPVPRVPRRDLDDLVIPVQPRGGHAEEERDGTCP
ncbi:nitroreductase [Crossiella equi]|uniref:Nitroreductase n=1 Tax=Crossiella equi TaxID=130796 RepID=A0ABS5A5E1_9PSEU|nr:nitroreductase family protein [Crossiella equi]MBP2471814.1 nitroreductase [Crossiella equi]